MKYDIFLSYRRKDAFPIAQLIYSELTQKGYRVSFDLENLGQGIFDTKLYSRIQASKDIIVILSQESFNFRENREDDHWRLEVEHAIALNKNIIPVLLPKVEVPKSLPEGLQILPKFNAIEWTHAHYKSTVQQMCSYLTARPRKYWLKPFKFCLILLVGLSIFYYLYCNLPGIASSALSVVVTELKKAFPSVVVQEKKVESKQNVEESSSNKISQPLVSSPQVTLWSYKRALKEAYEIHHGKPCTINLAEKIFPDYEEGKWVCSAGYRFIKTKESKGDIYAACSGAEWVEGQIHPENEYLVTTQRLDEWKSIRDGYVWVKGTSKIQWMAGQQHPKYRHVVSSEDEEYWQPEPGYDWAKYKDVNGKRRGVLESGVIWVKGKEHPKYRHVVSSEDEGYWQPKPGYDWVKYKDVNGKRRGVLESGVIWVKGKEHPKYLKVITGDKEGDWRPAPGYRWKNSNDGSDYSVVWSPGKEHTHHANVIAAKTEGKWNPAPGYKWANKINGDFSVIPHCSECNGTGKISCTCCDGDGEILCLNCDNGIRSIPCPDQYPYRGTFRENPFHPYYQKHVQGCLNCHGGITPWGPCRYCEGGLMLCPDCNGEGEIRLPCVNVNCRNGRINCGRCDDGERDCPKCSE